MKVVILDAYTANPGDLSWDAMKEYADLTVYDRTPHDEAEIIRRIGDADVVYTNKTPISAAVIDACPGVKMISVLATGYNIVDYVHAREKGIPVTNVPSYSTYSTAQMAIALLLEICEHTSEHSAAVHEGRWSSGKDFCFWDYPLIELCGKTMGIIGFGSIGRTVGAVAKALGMTVIASGSRPNPEGEAIGEYVELDELFARSDVVSLHCPLFPENKGIINRDNIAKMKDGVIILNNARGGLVVEQDLADALNSGKVYAAGIDVAGVEPINADSPLLTAKNCLMTPHISWATLEARTRLVGVAVENLKAFCAGKPQNVVN